ncbi:hypothetical protein ABPG72_022190 [Tetrahymena utriculariae]
MYIEQQAQQENINLEINYPDAPQVLPLAPAELQVENKQCCCWSFRVRQQQVESFLELQLIKGSVQMNDRNKYWHIVTFGNRGSCDFYHYQNQCQIFTNSQINEINQFLSKQSNNLLTAHFAFGIIASLICFFLAFPFFPSNNNQYNPNRLSLYLLCYVCYFDKKIPENRGRLLDLVLFNNLNRKYMLRILLYFSNRC